MRKFVTLEDKGRQYCQELGGWSFWDCEIVIEALCLCEKNAFRYSCTLNAYPIVVILYSVTLGMLGFYLM